MIRVEAGRVLRQGALLLAILAALVLSMLISEKDDFLAPVLEVFLLLFSSYMGWSVFDRERQEGALEYLLSLPVSRLKVLALKVLPRFLLITVVFSLYWLSHHLFQFPALYSPGKLLVFFLAFFFVAFSFSISFHNYLSALFVTAFLSLGFAYFGKMLDWIRPDMEVFVRANLPLILFPVFFSLVFHRYDIRGGGPFNLRLLPLLALAALAAGLYVYKSSKVLWGCHYLTQTGDVVRVECATCSKTEWISASGEVKRYPGCLHPLIEEKGVIYAELKTTRSNRLQLVTFDFVSGKQEVLYTADPGWEFRSWKVGQEGVFFKGKYYLLMRQWKQGLTRILEVDGKRTRVIDVGGDFPETERCRLFHIADDLKFLVYSMESIYIIDQSGRSRMWMPAQAVTAWKNRILTFNDSGMVLYPIQENPRPIFRMEGRVRKIQRRRSLFAHQYTLFRADGRIYLFNLETDTPQPLEITASPYDYLMMKKRFLIIEARGLNELRIKEMKAGHIISEDTWYPKVDARLIDVWPGGILVRDPFDNNFDVYRFY